MFTGVSCLWLTETTFALEISKYFSGDENVMAKTVALSIDLAVIMSQVVCVFVFSTPLIINHQGNTFAHHKKGRFAVL